MWLFVAAVAVSFAGMARTRKNYLIFWCFIIIVLAFQTVNALIWKYMVLMTRLFPLFFHVPIVLFIILYLKRTWLITLTSLFLSFLCYQLPRWIGSFAGEVFRAAAMNWGGVSEGVSENSGIVSNVVSMNNSAVLNTVSMNHLGLIAGAILTFYFVQKYAVKPARRLMERSVKSCLLFGAMPFIYYIFDYAVVIYSDLMYSGNRAVIQFLPSFMSAFYLAFVLMYHTEIQKLVNSQKEREMLDVQFRMAQTEFASMRQIQDNAASYRHDMRHHFALLQGLASGERIDELKDYLRTAQSDMDAITPVRFCENETVNLILSAYAAKANQSGIKLTIDAKLPDLLPFSDTELCSLLSNALENAIHACVDIPESNSAKLRLASINSAAHAAKEGVSRCINLHVYTKNNKLCINISNTCQSEPVFEQGMPVSKKQGHGFGTKSMVHIIEKHSGVFCFSVKDGWFTFQASV
jgi:hypothetical protein